MSELWLRKCSLVVLGAFNKGLDLSTLRIRFRIVQSDVQTPNHAIIRVFNLSDATARAVQKEFFTVTLQAGYIDGPYGVIFTGNIKQVRRGRVSQTDTYLDILAADGDEGYNFGTVNGALAAGWKAQDVLAAARKGLNAQAGYTPDLPPAAASRGKVMFGMARDTVRDLALTRQAAWSIQNGQLQLVPITSYIPGTITVLTAQTSMVELPVQTEGGISAKCLINPNLRIGSLVQIDNASIQRAFLGGNLLFAQGRLENLPGLLPKVTYDGFYRVYVVELTGDTRGRDWYSELTCLAVDRSAAQSDSVQAAATQ